MKRYGEFINEDRNYFNILKESLKKILMEKYGVTVHKVYVFIPDFNQEEVHIKLVRDSVQDIRRVPSAEIGIKETKAMLKFFEGVQEFGNEFNSYKTEISDTSISSTMTVLYKWNRDDFMSIQYFRSITGMTKYDL